MKSVGISIPADLLEQVDKERARRGVETGDTPSRSEWVREAAAEKLGIPTEAEVEAEQTVEA